MIKAILKKEFDQIQRKRKNGLKTNQILFKGFDGKYYSCDQVGFAGLKEIDDFNKKLRIQLESQLSLI